MFWQSNTVWKSFDEIKFWGNSIDTCIRHVTNCVISPKLFILTLLRQIFFSNGVNKQKYPKSAKLGHATGWLFLVNFETWGPTREFLKHFKSNNSDRIFDNLLKNTTKIYSGPNLNFYRCRKDQHYSQPKKNSHLKMAFVYLLRKG